MDSQLQELAREITQSLTVAVTESVTAAVTESLEKRLEIHFQKTDDNVRQHIDKLENRLEARLAIHFEGVKDQIQRGAEGYGATLESIDRRLDRLEKDGSRNFRLHSKVLKNHEGRLDAVEKRG